MRFWVTVWVLGLWAGLRLHDRTDLNLAEVVLVRLVTNPGEVGTYREDQLAEAFLVAE